MTCSNCGTDNPEGARFCGGCGQTLLDAAAAPPEPPPVEPVAPPAPIEPVAPYSAPTDPTAPISTVPPIPPMPPAPPDATTTFATPPPGPGPMPPATEAATKGSKKGLVIGLLALLVVAAVVGSFFAFGSDDEAVAEEIILEPIGLTLRDDFAGNLDEDPQEDSVDIALPEVPELDEAEADDDENDPVAPLIADGDEPGLYGGSRDTGVCDISALIDFLTDDRNADKAEAWADVQGIDVDEIEDFIDDLTPVRLRFDTRVTNHGFSNGQATPFQSVLEAGTAVLVDDTGVPRVKCNCGNPLTEPGYVDYDRVQNPDDEWDDYDPDLVVVIIINDPVDDFVLVDLGTGDLFLRPAGTDGDEDGDVDPDAICDDFVDSPTCNAPPDDDDDDDDPTTTTTPDDTTTTSIELGTGDVQVTLRWGSNADLDLVVIDPNGEEASRSGQTSTGGQLDVDSNVTCTEDGSVENVFWPPGAAPAGQYTVVVEGYGVAPDGSCGSGDYEVTVTIAGQAPQTFTGTVADEGESSHTFQVG